MLSSNVENWKYMAQKFVKFPTKSIMQTNNRIFAVMTVRGDILLHTADFLWINPISAQGPKHFLFRIHVYKWDNDPPTHTHYFKLNNKN